MEKINIKIEGEFNDLPCIYRMQLGKTKKFFIWKTKVLKPSLATLAKDMQRKIDKGCDDQDMFCKLASYMRANRVRNITVKVLVSTEDLVRLVHKEHEILAAASEDSRNCLNNSFTPYVPAWLKKELAEDDIDSVNVFVSNPETVPAEVPAEPVQKVTAPSFFNTPLPKAVLKGPPINLEYKEPELKKITTTDEDPEITLDDISAMAAKLRENK